MDSNNGGTPAHGLRAWNPLASKNSGGANSAITLIMATLRFMLGKPAGGGACMVSPGHIQSGKLIRRGGNGSVANFYRPDDDERWLLPAIAGRLKDITLVPMVMIGAHPQAFVMPISNWNGAASLLDLLADPTITALYYTYHQSIEEGAIGGYVAKRIATLEEPFATAYKAIRWPTPEEIWATIPVVSFERMIVEDYSYKVLADDAALVNA